MNTPYAHHCDKPSQRLREGLLFTCETCGQNWQYQGASSDGYWKAIIATRFKNEKQEQLEELLGPAVSEVNDGWIPLREGQELGITTHRPSEIMRWFAVNDSDGQGRLYIAERTYRKSGWMLDTYNVVAMTQLDEYNQLFRYNNRDLRGWEITPDWRSYVVHYEYGLSYDDMKTVMQDYRDYYGNHPDGTYTLVTEKL